MEKKQHGLIELIIIEDQLSKSRATFESAIEYIKKNCKEFADDPDISINGHNVDIILYDTEEGDHIMLLHRINGESYIRLKKFRFDYEV